MPYAKPICGIYKIQTPNGSAYVGSSINVKRRWAEHRSSLRAGRHHSSRLQAAFDKYGDDLLFLIVEECLERDLNSREQFYIDEIGAKLNTSPFVENIWLNPITREKFRAIHSSPDWRNQRSEIAKRNEKIWRAVDCSDGRTFKTMTDAANEFGKTVGSIRTLAQSQHLGALGVRFKFVGDEWRPIQTLAEKVSAGRKRNGTTRSQETKDRMSAAKKGKRLSNAALAASAEVTRRPVSATCKSTGEVRCFPSITDAAIALRPHDYKVIRPQITKACSGVKKSAYGYFWCYLARGAA